MSKWLDEIDFAAAVKIYGEPLQDYRVEEIRLTLEERAKQAILAHIDKVIGEDDEPDLNPLGMRDEYATRNDFREQLREELGI